MKKLISAVCFFLLLAVIGHGQSAGLGIGPDGITGLPETVYAGQKVEFKIQVQNKGLIPISGPINIFAATTQDSSVAFIGAVSIYVDSLLFGDTISAQIQVPIDTAALQFSMGGNTVVVWPAAIGAFTLDSITRFINIVKPPDTIGVNLFNDISFPDSAGYGLQDSIVFYVKNKRNAPYQGTIELWRQVISDSTSGISTKVDSTTLKNISLAPHESRRVAMAQNFTNPTYRMGGNTVVVWPAGNDIRTADTITGRVIVVDMGEVDEPKWAGYESVRIYPNPTNSLLSLLSNSDLKLESIKIFNIAGQMILETKEREVDISQLEPGTYFLTVYLKDGRQKSFKLLKQ